MTNNAISLRTLTERLNYGRMLITQFWEAELRLFQKAMGFRTPATVVFDYADLSDDSSQLRLLIELADRDLISVEALQEKFGLIPEIERLRRRREGKMRERGTIPPKAGPFHDADTVAKIKAILAGTGQYAPSELGVEMKPKKKGEKAPAEGEQKAQLELQDKANEQFEKQAVLVEQQTKLEDAKRQHTEKKGELADKAPKGPAPKGPGAKKPGAKKPGKGPAVQPKTKKKGEPGKGRPPGTKDSTQRKRKTVKPRQAVKGAEEEE